MGFKDSFTHQKAVKILEQKPCDQELLLEIFKNQSLDHTMGFHQSASDDFIHMWNLISKINKQNIDRLIENKLTVVAGRAGWGVEGQNKIENKNKNNKLMDWDNSVMIPGRGGNEEGEERRGT